MSGEARLADEKAQHCMVDAARLADELRAEQVGVSSEWLTRPAWLMSSELSR
jgi:hypothetical protein